MDTEAGTQRQRRGRDHRRGQPAKRPRPARTAGRDRRISAAQAEVRRLEAALAQHDARVAGIAAEGRRPRIWSNSC